MSELTSEQVEKEIDVFLDKVYSLPIEERAMAYIEGRTRISKLVSDCYGRKKDN